MDIHVLRSFNRRGWVFRIYFSSTQLQTRTQLFLSRTNRTTPASFCRNRGGKSYRYLHSCRWIRIDGARLGVLLPVDGEDAAAKVSLWLITVERSGASMVGMSTDEQSNARRPRCLLALADYSSQFQLPDWPDKLTALIWIIIEEGIAVNTCIMASSLHSASERK